ncbi:MAG: sugar ABC transporter permease, partial [Nevskiales bacterium]
MADGTSIPVAAIAPARPMLRPRGGMQRFMRRRSSISLMMALPLILLVAGLVIYPAVYALYLAMLNKRMTQF